MILVTGGTGFVGRAVVRTLLARGDRVRILSRAQPSAPLAAGAEWARGDLATGEGLREALGGVDVVIHCAAALDGPGDPARIERVNVDGTRRLAEAAAESGVAQFIHVSSAGVYGDSDSPLPRGEDDAPTPRTTYERSKLRGEEVLRRALEGRAVRWTILRPTGVFGAGRPATTALFAAAARRRVWVHGTTVTVHPLYVDDLASAIARCVGDERVQGQVINLGGDRALDYRELLSLIAGHAGRRPIHLAPPRSARALARTLVRVGAANERRLAALVRLARPVYRSVRIDRARALLDYRPTPLEGALALTARGIAERA